jgi:U3 small nucleolar RNA-associated protein 19
VKSIRDKAQRNILFYLEAFKIPDAKTQELANFVQLSDKDKRPGKALKPPVKHRKKQRDALDKAWKGFLDVDLPTKLYLDVLIKVPEVIIPAMKKPLLLADFLTDSYNFGGELAIASLYGLYTLMRDHGLDYPDFYHRLYTMLKPNIFKSRRKAMFLKLIRVFLSSKFLPESLMAAFAKRLSRLALTASTEGAVFCIETALIRVDSIQYLIHRKLSRLDEKENLDKIREIDPFLEDCDNPESCQAQESSLWEIKSLQNHYLPEVSKAAKKINKPRRKDLPKPKASTATIRSIATALLTTRRHQSALEYTRRKKLFDKLNGDSIFNEAFALCV